MTNIASSSVRIKEELCSSQEDYSHSVHTASTSKHTEYLAACIEKKLFSQDGKNLDQSTPGVGAAQIKLEPVDIPEHLYNNHFLTNHIKEETCDYKEEFLPLDGQYLGVSDPSGHMISNHASVSSPPYPSLCIKQEVDLGEEEVVECTAFCIKEEFPSKDSLLTEDNLHTSGALCIKQEVDLYEEVVEYTAVCIKEELPSEDDFSTEDYPIEHTSEVSPDSFILVEKEDSNCFSDHTEIEYSTVCLKGEESSKEDYVELTPDADNYITRDHTYMVTQADICMKTPCNTRKLQKTLKCTECGKVFFSKTAYRIHQKLHRGEAVYVCTTCGKKFSRKGSCENHQEAAHSRQKSLKCANCDRCFSSKLGLTLHQRIHTREPAFICKNCDMSFTSNSALIQHQRIHYIDRRLLCAKCGLNFENKSDLINHEILHPAQQAFVCSECSEKFLDKADLFAHWKIHTVIRAFSWRKIQFTHQENHSPKNSTSGSGGE